MTKVETVRNSRGGNHRVRITKSSSDGKTNSLHLSVNEFREMLHQSLELIDKEGL